MTVTVAMKKQVIERDGGICQLALLGCTREAQTTDHRANRGSGGSTVLDHGANLVAACVLCNGAKADASGPVLIDLEDRGLYIRFGRTNAHTLEKAKQTPFQAPDGRWYFARSLTSRELVDVVLGRRDG